MQYGTEDGDIHWQGYSIESITTFLNDVVDIVVNQKLISELQTERPSFKESLISTMVVEAAHLSLENESNWQLFESLK